ncbi:hypothetical protein [Caryophanon latum]|uniref:Uncharacterized protein n=1 Tax=Caryophanon latum TaxID=33977 RepID=A0A1C0YNX1_9BACL|nr:hypothetical protein [Caryophanon latum]OCS88857.1 hypothetical protein A6K76_13650 [Caryophanon latum]
MIVNKVSYGGENLVTVYHRGIEDEVESYERKIIKQKINQYNLCFEQYKVNVDDLNNITSTLSVQEGFLTPKDNLNIYSSRVCARVTRYVSAVKPRKIIKTLEDKFEFNLSIETIININEFIKKYTGLDLNKNPIFYGDTFIFEPIEIDLCKNESKGLTIRNIEAHSEIVIRFRNNGMIVYAYKRLFEDEVLEVEINPEIDWTFFDIEFYKDNELIFCDSDLFFFGSMRLSMGISNRPKSVKLNSLSSYLDIPTEPTRVESVIGEEINQIEDLYAKSNFEMSRKIRNEQEVNNITFIKPGETNRALKEITEFLNKNFEEVWIFDPYFTDRTRFNKTFDWLKIFSELPLKKINFLFYCKNEDNAYSYNALETEVVENALLDNIIENKTLNWTFIETKSAIHDRFILTKASDGQFSGITVGTSLNSVDTNHFCINHLNHNSTKTILNELSDFLDDENVKGFFKI